MLPLPAAFALLPGASASRRLRAVLRDGIVMEFPSNWKPAGGRAAGPAGIESGWMHVGFPLKRKAREKHDTHDRGSLEAGRAGGRDPPSAQRQRRTTAQRV